MTTELEKTFFDKFGIEPDVVSAPNYHWEDYVMQYPQITNKHYLKLICLFTKEMNCYTCYTSDLEMLKENILKEFILEKDSFTKHQVQAIFEGER